MRILVTAFDAFGGEEVNAAALAVAALPPRVAGAEIIPVEVPTVFGASVDVVRTAIALNEPDAVVCVGQAGGRSAVTPERVAINVDDARIPDNAGNRPVDTAIDPLGPPARFATLPVKAMVAAVRAIGVPAELSNTAGTFVCNHLMYGVLHHLAREGREGVRAGFVHVPRVDAGLTTEEVTRALIACLEAVVAHAQDLPLAEGALD